MKRLAQFISFLFHPMLLPTYGYLFWFYYLPSSNTFSDDFLRTFVLTIFFFTYLVPILSITAMFLYNHNIQSKEGILNLLEEKRSVYQEFIFAMEMQRREDRIYPMLLTTGIYLVVMYLLANKINLVGPFLIVLAVTTVALFLTTIVSFFWKISAHSVGVGGMTGILFFLQYVDPGYHLLYPILIAILLSGTVMTCRLYLKAHIPSQAYWGFLLGFSVAMPVSHFLWIF